MKRLLPVLLLACAVAAAVAAGTASPGAFRTGIIPNPGLGEEADAVQFARIRAAGASFIRIEIAWGAIAPLVRPKGFNPTNPGDPAYRWETIDSRVRLAVKNHLFPILGIAGAPLWAQPKKPPTKDGAYKPSPKMYGQFAKAAARRYGGSYHGLPRVRYWRAWNEPNIYRYLTPVKEKGKDFSPFWYAKLVAAFSASVHGVHRDNHVIAGSLAPFGIDRRISPLTFMREMLCMSKPKKGKKPKATCKRQLKFDIFALHPYTRGNPFHQATSPNDVSLGDLPEVRQLLDAAKRVHHIKPNHPLQLWVTEFSYNSRPPGVSKLVLPVLLHARYTSESLYEMWRSGASLGTWFLLRDDTKKHFPYFDADSGLYFRGADDVTLSQDWPKPSLTAFRFPFVAYRGTPPAGPGVKKLSKKRVYFWGRTPKSSPGKISISVGTRKGWKRIGSAHAHGGGTFKGTLAYSKVDRVLKSKPSKTTYRSAVIADHPRSYWRLNQRKGNIAADEMHRAPGTFKGGVKRGVPGALQGNRNRATGNRAALFRSGGRVELPPMKAPHAIDFWMKTTRSGHLPAASFGSDTDSELRVGAAQRFPRASAPDRSVSGFNYVNDNKWHYVAYSYSGGEAHLYVDGVLTDEEPWGASFAKGDANLAYDPLLNSYFRGTLSEVAVYDHALSASQVAKHFAASGRTILTFGLLRAQLGPAVSWPFSLKRPPDRFVLPLG